MVEKRYVTKYITNKLLFGTPPTKAAENTYSKE
jgi:hypothetical protein